MPVRKAEAEEAAIGPGSLRKETVRENEHRGPVGVGLQLRVTGCFRNERTPVRPAKSGSRNSGTLACILGSRKPCGLTLKTKHFVCFHPQTAATTPQRPRVSEGPPPMTASYSASALRVDRVQD